MVCPCWTLLLCTIFSVHNRSVQSINDRFLSWCTTAVNQGIMTPVFIDRERVSLIGSIGFIRKPDRCICKKRPD